MKTFDENEIRKLPFDRLKLIIEEGFSFKVLASSGTGQKVRQFLKNEEIYARSGGGLKGKTSYFFGALSGFSILHIIPVINSAKLNGYAMNIADESSSQVAIVFQKKSGTGLNS